MKKKNYFYAMMAFATLALSMTFTACSSDDDDKSVDEPEAKVKNVNCKLSCTLTQDWLEVADITTNLSINGNVQMDTLTTTEYSKEIIIDEFPATVSFAISCASKEVELVKEKYTFGYDFERALTAVNSDNSTVSFGFSKSDKSLTVAADKVDTLLAKRPVLHTQQFRLVLNSDSTDVTLQTVQ